MMNTRLLFISLLCLGLCGVLLSLLAACLGPAYPEGRCDFCVASPILIAMGIVNFILSILPVTIGLIGIYAEQWIKVFGGLSIFFSVIAVPNIVGLGWVTQFYAGILAGNLVIAYCSILMMMYMVEMILVFISMYKMKFTCCTKPEDSTITLDRLEREMPGMPTMAPGMAPYPGMYQGYPQGMQPGPPMQGGMMGYVPQQMGAQGGPPPGMPVQGMGPQGQPNSMGGPGQPPVSMGGPGMGGQPMMGGQPQQMMGQAMGGPPVSVGMPMPNMQQNGGMPHPGMYGYMDPSIYQQQQHYMSMQAGTAPPPTPPLQEQQAVQPGNQM